MPDYEMGRKVNLRYHSVPQDLFDALAAGGGGGTAARALAAAEWSKHVTLLRGVLAAAQVAGGEQTVLARRGYDLLAEVQRYDSVAAGTVIRNPSVGAWARRAILTSGGGSAVMVTAQPGRLSAVAVAAAIRAGLPAEIEVPVSGGSVMLPTLGTAQAVGSTAVVRTAPGSTQVCSGEGKIELPDDPHQDAAGWQGLRRVQAGSLDVLIDDLDPFRMKPSESLAPRLNAVDASKLAGALQAAWELIESHHASVAAEIAAMVTVIVPYLTPSHGQVSASSAENFGAIAVSSSDDPISFAATLAHETQHLKLCALLDIVALTLPDDDQRYYAPWRADSRPISSLLQGAYAFLGVAAFWRRQRQLAEGDALLRADTEFARWRAASARVADTLFSSDRLTSTGQKFVRRMQFTLSQWQGEPVLPAAQAIAQRVADLHQARWELDNGRLPAG